MRRGQNVADRAIVLFELYNIGILKMLLKIKDISYTEIILSP